MMQQLTAGSAGLHLRHPASCGYTVLTAFRQDRCACFAPTSPVVAALDKFMLVTGEQQHRSRLPQQRVAMRQLMRGSMRVRYEAAVARRLSATEAAVKVRCPKSPSRAHGFYYHLTCVWMAGPGAT